MWRTLQRAAMGFSPRFELGELSSPQHHKVCATTGPRYTWTMRYLSLLLLGSSAFAGRVDVVEEIVCKVNGDIITHNDLDHDRKQLEQQLRQQNLSGPRLQDVLNSKMADLLRDRIDRLLMVQKG